MWMKTHVSWSHSRSLEAGYDSESGGSKWLPAVKVTDVCGIRISQLYRGTDAYSIWPRAVIVRYPLVRELSEHI